MKVTRHQLRKIIREQITTTAVNPILDNMINSLDEAINNWVEMEWEATLIGEYTDQDPAMVGDLDSWSKQVRQAATELKGALAQAAEQELSEIEGKLYGGEYLP